MSEAVFKLTLRNSAVMVTLWPSAQTQASSMNANKVPSLD